MADERQVELTVQNSAEIAHEAIKRFEAWQFEKAEYVTDVKTPFDFLPQNVKDAYFDYIMANNSKRELAEMLINYTALDYDSFAHDILDIAEQEEGI